MIRILMLLASVVVVVALAFLTLPEDPGRMDDTETVSSELEIDRQAAVEEEDPVDPELERRLQAMKEVYAKLERERRDLRTRLRDVSYYLNRAEDLPLGQRREMRDDIASAGRRLINPPQLGAFSGVEDIRAELKRIVDINARLDDMEARLREHGVDTDSERPSTTSG